MLEAIQRPHLLPLSEIHLAARGFDKEGKSRRKFSSDEWKYRLSVLSSTLRTAVLTLEVFVWDSFHDRYSVSDVVCINLNGGLDINAERDEETTWNRLARSIRDEIQREFIPKSRKHQLLDHFNLP